MPRTIEHRAAWDVSAETVYSVLTDADFLAARLQELGGKDPALVEHDVDATGARLRLRSSVPLELLPGAVRRIVGGDLVLERVETWTPEDAGRYRGTVEVTVRGLPGRLSGSQSLHDDGTGSATEVTGSTVVPIPLVAGRIEDAVAEQVENLLDAEDEFARRWLAARR